MAIKCNSLLIFLTIIAASLLATVTSHRPGLLLLGAGHHPHSGGNSGHGHSAAAAQSSTKKYKLIPGSFTWHSASGQCSTIGGSMPVVESQQENENIQKVITSNFAWIGLQKPSNGASWQWTDGRTIGSGFSAWAANEPKQNGRGQRCAYYKNSQWHDTVCVDLRNALCEVSH